MGSIKFCSHLKSEKNKCRIYNMLNFLPAIYISPNFCNKHKKKKTAVKILNHRKHKHPYIILIIHGPTKNETVIHVPAIELSHS